MGKHRGVELRHGRGPLPDPGAGTSSSRRESDDSAPVRSSCRGLTLASHGGPAATGAAGAGRVGFQLYKVCALHSVDARVEPWHDGRFEGVSPMKLGVFIPIGNNGWLISTTSPQYMPSFDLNRTIVEKKAERFGFDFALSMIKLHGFGGPSQFWDHNLESLHLDGGAGRGHQADRVVRDLRRAHHTARPSLRGWRSPSTASRRGRFGVNIISGWQRAEYAQMGIWPGADHYRRRYEFCAEYVTIMKGAVVDRAGPTSRGDFFTMDDCRCSPLPSRQIPIICAAQSDAGTRYAATHADYNFCASFGINQPTAVAVSVARLVAANQATGTALRRAGADHDHRRRDGRVRHGEVGALQGPAPITRRWTGGTNSPTTTRRATPSPRAQPPQAGGMAPTGCQPTRACWWAATPASPPCWTRWRRCPAWKA